LIAFGWFILGIVALVGGAELIVRGGSRLAARLGIPPMVIGLTIVSVGTSTPELAVGVEAALRGNGSLAVGNIVGTNMVNVLFILGLSAFLKPLALKGRILRFDLPVMTAAAVMLLVMAWDGILSRFDGGVLVFAAILYSTAIIGWTRRESRRVRAEYASEYGALKDSNARDAAFSALMLVVGIAVTVTGSGWLVDGAVDLARMLGVSDAFIGLTIVAVGTSSPELVTTIVGTLRNDRDIAIGNLLGSSIYNILLILGISCLVPSSGVTVGLNLARVDIPLMTAVAFVSVPVFLTGRRVTRPEGGLFVGAYFGYLIYLLLTRL
jgi:cation:H+ antiporter